MFLCFMIVDMEIWRQPDSLLQKLLSWFIFLHFDRLVFYVVSLLLLCIKKIQQYLPVLFQF